MSGVRPNGAAGGRAAEFLTRRARVLPAGALALALSGCYHPDLGAQPFACRSADAADICPPGYDCMDRICVRRAPPAADARETAADSPAPACMRPDPAFCPDRDVEPNDSKEKATPLNFGTSIDWAICTASDKDYFRIELAAGEQIKVVLRFKTCGSNGALDMVFFGGSIPETAPITSFADPSGRLLVAKAQLDDPQATKGTFYLEVFAPSSTGGPNTYELDVQAVE